jgi:hypothetical protein
MKLRIHHFFDILRDFGSGKTLSPHPYQHAYHLVAREIWNNPQLPIELVIASDAVCLGCIHLVDSTCDDVITHRADFSSKEEFNNHLDRRIMKTCGMHFSEHYTPEDLCKRAEKYLENIFFIYEGNDEEHTRERKRNVLIGVKLYSARHGIAGCG